MSGDQFSLVWNSFPTNLSSGLYTLLTDEHLVDVTLAAEGQILRAHKLILSVCSTYFKELFETNSCKHPIVILKDVNYRDLYGMLQFMYQGEVNIKQEDLASFLKVAETLRIKGLATGKNKNDDNSIANENLCGLARNSEESCEKFDSFLKTDTEPETRAKDQLSTELSPQLVAKEFVPNEISDQDNESLTTVEPHSIMKETLGTGSDDMENRISRPAEESLDYKLNIASLTETKNEPLDYTSDIDLDVPCDKNYSGHGNITDNQHCNLNRENNSNQINDCPSNSTLSPSCEPAINRDEPRPSSHLEESFRPDFSYNVGSYGKGRRTVKGIPGSSLPLESTLRVVSELGPTLQVEREKVTRMYSCPWCLRYFTRKENLKLHLRYIHGPLESLTCKLCGNKYKNSNSLRVHSYLYHNTKQNKHGKRTRVNSGIQGCNAV